ncbi:hypothetical protein [Escherichia coli]|uniref:hypothetical protein n=1 Tax=Escherichia coli TaxID=562 RepID=UPI00189511FE
MISACRERSFLIGFQIASSLGIACFQRRLDLLRPRRLPDSFLRNFGYCLPDVYLFGIFFLSKKREQIVWKRLYLQTI